MKLLPGTELPVGSVCLGTADAGSGMNDETFFAILDAYTDRGGCFVDTANVYGRWAPGGLNRSEAAIGRWLASRKKPLTVATKGAHYALSDRRARVTRDDLAHDVETSLSALGVERIDLYYLHRDDERLPVADICEWLNEHIRAGRLRYLGASNWRIDRVTAFNEYAAAHGLCGFCAVSNQHQLARVDPAHNTNPDPTLVICDADELAFHRRTGLPLIPFSSTAHGYFAKRARGGAVPPGLDAAFGCPENDEILARLTALSAETGLSVQTLTITELVETAGFPLIPVVGVSRPAQLEDVLAAMDVLGQN